MKRTRLWDLPERMPPELSALATGAPLYDSSCSPDARVYFIDRDGGYFLKSSAAGTLRAEAEKTRFFYERGLGAEVLAYVTDGDRDFLLTRRVPGEDCTHAAYLAEPERLCDLMAEALRRLHALPTEGCPAPDHLQRYLALAEENYRTGNYDREHFPDSFGYRSAEEAISVLREGRHHLTADTLIHGDYCLPNIMLNGWRFSGFIDLGNSGVADRHIDLFWGVWTLSFNLHTDRYGDRFLDAYGREAVDKELLRVVAAAEVFG